jgi:type I restriction enzyme S subunit
MELNKGYKKTDIGVFPIDWDCAKIGSFTGVKAGGTPSTNVKEYWGGNIRWMNSGELNLKIVSEVENRITELGLDESAANLFPKNCVLIGLAGQGKTRGTAAINVVELCTNQSIAAIFPSETVDYLYLYYNLDSRYNELRGMSTGDGGRGGLNLKIIKSIYIPIPKKKEQLLISEALSSIDKLLKGLEKLIAKKRNIKQGAMQKLLQPKEGWEVKKLGAVVGRVTTGKLDANAMKENGEYRFYTCAKDYYLIDEYAFDTEALLVSGNGANVGYIHYYKGKFNAYQRTYVLTDFSINVFYIKLYLDSYLKDRITTEVSAGNTPYIKMDTITDMVIHYPSNVEEQTRIATILSDIDAEITALETKLEKYKKVKLGMMQNLLTGKIRLI